MTQDFWVQMNYAPGENTRQNFVSAGKLPEQKKSLSIRELVGYLNKAEFRAMYTPNDTQILDTVLRYIKAHESNQLQTVVVPNTLAGIKLNLDDRIASFVSPNATNQHGQNVDGIYLAFETREIGGYYQRMPKMDDEHA